MLLKERKSLFISKSKAGGCESMYRAVEWLNNNQPSDLPCDDEFQLNALNWKLIVHRRIAV
jgi:hypothetical protein